MIGVLLFKLKPIYEKNKVFNAYADYIENHALYEGFEKGELENNETQLVFSLEYLDEDDIPELVLGWTKMLNESSDICILKYVDGEVKQLGPFGHYNCVNYIPGENILYECNSWAGKTSYWYFKIDKEGRIETLCEAYMPMNDEQEIFAIKEEYYVAGQQVTKAKYEKFVNDLSTAEFVSWSGACNQINLDILNKYNLRRLRKGKIEISKNTRLLAERAENPLYVDYYDINDFDIIFTTKVEDSYKYPVLSTKNAAYDYVLKSINQDYLELIAEAKESKEIKSIEFDGVDIKEIDNLAYVTINEMISTSSQTDKFNKTYVIEKNNKIFANLYDIFMSNNECLEDVAKQVCKLDDKFHYDIVTNELLLNSNKRSISWSLLNGELQIHIDSDVLSEGSKNIKYEVVVQVDNLKDDDRELSQQYLEYKQVLNEYMNECESEIAAELVDFDDDGYKELVVMTGDAHNNLVDIYTYNAAKEKAEYINEPGCGENGLIMYYPHKNVIYSEYNGPNYMYREYYAITDNRAELIDSLRLDFDEDLNIIKCTSNIPYERVISESDYSKIIDNYEKLGELNYISYSTSMHIKSRGDIEKMLKVNGV